MSQQIKMRLEWTKMESDNNNQQNTKNNLKLRTV